MPDGASGQIGGNSYVGVALETAASTYATGTSSLEFYSGGMVRNIESQKMETISKLRGFSKRIQTIESYEGSFEYPLAPDKACIQLLYNAMGGTVTTTTLSAAVSWTHLISGGTFTGTYSSLSITQRIGSEKMFQICGCRTNEFKMTCEIGSEVKASSSLIGTTWTTSADIVSSLTQSATMPFVFHQGTFKFSGTTEVITKAEITIANNLASGNEMRQIGAKCLSGCPPAGKRDVSMSLSMRFDTLTAYTRFINNDYGAVQLVFDSGITIPASTLTYKLTIDMPKVYYNAPTPEMGGPNEILMQEITCDCIVDNPTATGYDIQFTFQNGESTIV